MKSDGESGSPLKTVFVNSTRRDIDRLRSTVRAVLEVHLRDVVEAFPQETWNSSLDPTALVTECRKRLMEADAFVLILGLWYGWMPKGYKQSITHLEFTVSGHDGVGQEHDILAYSFWYRTLGHNVARAAQERRRLSEGMDLKARAKYKLWIDAFHEEAIGGKRTGTLKETGVSSIITIRTSTCSRSSRFWDSAWDQGNCR
jgi:hypothetical protein